MTGRRHLRVPVSRGELSRTVRFFRADEVHERINEGQVGEGLRKVAEVTAIHRKQLPGVEPQWAGWESRRSNTALARALLRSQ
jgi:hypothetical protein